MKKIFTLLLTTILMLLVSSNVFATEKIYIDGSLFYKINNNEITVIKYTGDEKSITLPMNIGGYNVTSIAKNAFDSNIVKEIKLPETIKSIDDGAFTNIDIIKISFFDKNGEITDRQYPTIEIIDDGGGDTPNPPIVDDDPVEPVTPPDDIEDDNPQSPTDGDTDNPEKPTEPTNDNPSSDSSSSVIVGDIVENHSDMVSEAYVSISNVLEREKDEESVEVVNNNSSSETVDIVSNTNSINKDNASNSPSSIVYVVVGIGLAGAAYYYIVKKKKK